MPLNEREELEYLRLKKRKAMAAPAASAPTASDYNRFADMNPRDVIRGASTGQIDRAEAEKYLASVGMDAGAIDRFGKPKSMGEAADTFIRGGLQQPASMYTFGLADEIGGTVAGTAAALASKFTDNPITVRSGIDEATRQMREKSDAFNKAAPLQSTALNLIGGVAGAKAMMNVPAVGKAMAGPQGAGALKAVGRIGTAAATGAVQGGAYGFGSGEGLQNRLDKAGEAAAVGAVFGGAAGAAVEGFRATGKAYQTAREMIKSAKVNPDELTTANDLRKTYKDISKAAKDVGAIARPEAAQPLLAEMDDILGGLRLSDAPKAFEIADDIRNTMKGGIELSEVDNLFKRINLQINGGTSKLGDMTPDAAVLSQIKRKLVDMVNGIDPAMSLKNGTPEAIEGFSKARQVWTQKLKADDVQNMFKMARNPQTGEVDAQLLRNEAGKLWRAETKAGYSSFTERELGDLFDIYRTGKIGGSVGDWLWKIVPSHIKGFLPNIGVVDGMVKGRAGAFAKGVANQSERVRLDAKLLEMNLRDLATKVEPKTFTRIADVVTKAKPEVAERVLEKVVTQQTTPEARVAVEALRDDVTDKVVKAVASKKVGITPKDGAPSFAEFRKGVYPEKTKEFNLTLNELKSFFGGSEGKRTYTVNIGGPKEKFYRNMARFLEERGDALGRKYQVTLEDDKIVGSWSKYANTGRRYFEKVSTNWLNSLTDEQRSVAMQDLDELKRIKITLEPLEKTSKKVGVTESIRGIEDKSWVIINKATGKAELETFDKELVNSLNERFEAIPIGKYLADLNKKIKQGGQAFVKGAERVVRETDGFVVNPIGPKSAPQTYSDIMKVAARNNVDLGLNVEKDGTLNLYRIIADNEGRGDGSRVMKAIIEYADANGKKIKLTPDASYGASSVSRLKEFYKRFGFVENKGRNRDFSISDDMYRIPNAGGFGKDQSGSAGREAMAALGVGGLSGGIGAYVAASGEAGTRTDTATASQPQLPQQQFTTKQKDELGDLISSLESQPASADVSPDILQKIAMVESSGNPNAKAKTSSATGLHQFTSKTWLNIVDKYEPELAKGKTKADLLRLRKNPEVSERMAGYLVQENTNILKRLGAPVNDASVYLAHFAGAEKAAKAFKADPNAPAIKVFGADAVKANKSVLKGKRVKDVIAWAERKMGV